MQAGFPNSAQQRPVWDSVQNTPRIGCTVIGAIVRNCPTERRKVLSPSRVYPRDRMLAAVISTACGCSISLIS